ncbi:MAG: nucleoside phosphorylase [Eudoraea sp.]|nr:nucleoside phosphorylase [Eudoraea sp.]MBT8211389.1 nucleoside phosphorylase [Eudoraea sp.]NNK29314.1 nucleoside phosphorylase [Flavobacteriaceae bacterium]
MPLKASELILNEDQSIYHLNLVPEDLGETVIVVGDQNRVPRVSKHFDRIDIKKSRREFVTHTGWLKNKRISVVSTGIGADNIDIVLNELDALVNIDFDSKTVKEELTRLDIVRIGTSGGIQTDIPVDGMVVSEYAIGFDNVLHFYNSEHIQHPEMQLAFIDHMDWSVYKSIPYVVAADQELTGKLMSSRVIPGFTGTNVGFYGPQGRKLRLGLEDEALNNKMASFEFNGLKITNLEMETSALFGLASLMGHRAASINCILANRTTGEFSKDPAKAVDKLIAYALEKLVGV